MHHSTAVPTVITLLIMVGFQRRLASFVLPEKIYRPPGDTRKKLIHGVRLVLHPCNNFTFTEKHRKEPLRRSPRIKAKVADCSEQQYDVQQNLFETDDNIQL